MKEALEQSRHSLEWLKFNQRQLDADGVEVAVSRQALNEVLVALEIAIVVAQVMLAALKVIAGLENKTNAECLGLLKRARHIAKVTVAAAEGVSDD